MGVKEEGKQDEKKMKPEVCLLSFRAKERELCC